jgi:hypothetical protein
MDPKFFSKIWELRLAPGTPFKKNKVVPATKYGLFRNLMSS